MLLPLGFMTNYHVCVLYVYMYISAYVCIHKALADGLVGQDLAGSVSEYNTKF